MSVLADLQDALRAAGVTLPFLALHHSTWSSNDESPGLTKLSACPFGTARQLTAALPKGTS
ncbi:hypothetical protein [Streptomyces qinglanensis]|uniref:hypothetical protein n=1 Tax=Streptomyces qinglanensis TaxID=943816 RepID=UPI003D73FBF3